MILLVLAIYPLVGQAQGERITIEGAETVRSVESSIPPQTLQLAARITVMEANTLRSIAASRLDAVGSAAQDRIIIQGADTNRAIELDPLVAPTATVQAPTATEVPPSPSSAPTPTPTPSPTTVPDPTAMPTMAVPEPTNGDTPVAQIAATSTSAQVVPSSTTAVGPTVTATDKAETAPEILAAWIENFGLIAAALIGVAGAIIAALITIRGRTTAKKP